MRRAAGDDTVELPIFETVPQGITVIGSIVGTRADLREVYGLHGAGRTCVIRETRTLDQVNESIVDVNADRSPHASSSSSTRGVVFTASVCAGRLAATRHLGQWLQGEP